MASNYNKLHEKQYDELMIKYEKQEKLLKEIKNTVKELNETIKNQNLIITKLTEENNELKNEILRLKSKNDRDSSNSSKPSSTNGYKKVITNRREKSTNKQGGQKNHAPHSLNNKLNQFIDSGDVEEEIIEINKNEKNENKRYIEKVVIDIKIVKHITRYRYYVHDDGKYHIPKIHNQYVQYGNNIKGIAMDLLNNLPNSTDGVTQFVNDITNGGITLSKGTLINWESSLASKLSHDINKIEEKLLESYYVNHDESQIKIDSNGYNVLGACNDKYVRLWPSEHKSQDAIDQINFLPRFKGVIVKDGTELYNKYGLLLAQCISHILRYLKGIYDFINHKGPKKLSDFFKKYNDLRNDYIQNKKLCFTNIELADIIKEYDNILDEWEKELREDKNNYLFDEELNLFKRLKYDNKKMDPKIRGDRDEVLYFLKDFNVPATNNPIETAQRGVKIKQKIGKFRSVEGADNYLTIKSCILTYKKQKLDILKSLIGTFEGKNILA